MTLHEAITFLRAHGLRVRWTPQGTLSPSDVCALISVLANRQRGQA